jgi:uncharacterized phiE125 gp8 family phage protein
MGLKLITGPATDPVTVSEIKEYYRGIDGSEMDTTIGNLIKAARDEAQNYQNRAFFTQVWELSFDRFPAMPVEIPLPPLQSLVSVKYIDSEGAEYSIDINDFIVDKRSEPGRITFKSGKSWPSVRLQSIDSVIFQFTAGYNDVGKIPHSVKLAYLLYVTYFLDHPDATEPPQAFYKLLEPERVVPV